MPEASLSVLRNSCKARSAGRRRRRWSSDFGSIKDWAIFVPGSHVADRIVRDVTLVMTEEAFEVLCDQNRKDVTDNIRNNENDDDCDVLEQDHLKGAELRML
jgi:hypothetical protein